MCVTNGKCLEVDKKKIETPQNIGYQSKRKRRRRCEMEIGLTLNVRDKIDRKKCISKTYKNTNEKERRNQNRRTFHK